LNGSFFVSRAAADQYRKQESGAFVHITSTSGLIGNMGQANYASAKLGITALSKAIAIDMKRFNVRSNCLSPWAWSRMTQSIPARTEEERSRVGKLQQMTPDKNAPMAVFLASDAARDVTGQVFGTRMNEIYLFSSPADPQSASRRGLDPGGYRRARSPRARILTHAARPLRRLIFLGPALKRIINVDLRGLRCRGRVVRGPRRRTLPPRRPLRRRPTARLSASPMPRTSLPRP
jgi:hypothetical protein